MTYSPVDRLRSVAAGWRAGPRPLLRLLAALRWLTTILDRPLPIADATVNIAVTMDATMDALEVRVEWLRQDVIWLRAMLREKQWALAEARREVYRRLIRPVAPALHVAGNGHR